MSGQGAAPDVDLRSKGTQGFNQIIVGAAVVGLIGYYFSRDASSKPSEGESGLDQTEHYALEIFWTVVWLLYRLFQLVAGLALCLLLVLVVRQRSILYVPVPPNTARSPKENQPAQIRSPDCHPWNMDYENVMITTEDGVKINAWFIYHKINSSAPDEVPYTVVYFHGNAGNIGFRLENLRDMHKKLNLNILILDYRGYGDSEDGPGCTEDGFMKDAKATYRWLVDRIRNPPANEKTKMSLDRILLFGRSIGGVVALRLGAILLEERLDALAKGKEPQPLPAGFVLENTFTSLRDMAVQVFPFLYYLKPILRAPLIYDEWKGNDALEYMVKNNEHWGFCLLSGLKDTLVPPEMVVSLHNLLKKQPPKVVKFFKFRDGGHNDTPTRGGAEYWTSFKKFLDAVAEAEPERKAFYAAQEDSRKCK